MNLLLINKSTDTEEFFGQCCTSTSHKNVLINFYCSCNVISCSHGSVLFIPHASVYSVFCLVHMVVLLLSVKY